MWGKNPDEGVVGLEGGGCWAGAALGAGERGTRKKRGPGRARLPPGQSWREQGPGAVGVPPRRYRRRRGSRVPGAGGRRAQAGRAAAGRTRSRRGRGSGGRGRRAGRNAPGAGPDPRPPAAGSRRRALRGERTSGLRESCGGEAPLSGLALPQGCAAYRGTAGSTLRAAGPALDRAAAGSGGRGTARFRSATGGLVVGGRGRPRSFCLCRPPWGTSPGFPSPTPTPLDPSSHPGGGGGLTRQ